MIGRCSIEREGSGISFGFRREAADPGRADADAAVSLGAWRDPRAEHSIDTGFDVVLAPWPPSGPMIQEMRRMPRARGKYAHVPGGSEDHARRKREEIALEEASEG